MGKLKMAEESGIFEKNTGRAAPPLVRWRLDFGNEEELLRGVYCW